MSARLRQRPLHLPAPLGAVAVQVEVPHLSRVATGAARQTLVDMAYEALRDGITSGVLLPGTRLREAALARHFTISTTPCA